MILIAQIQRAVAEKRHMSVRALKGRRGSVKLTRSRHDAMYLAKRLTGHSYATIGKHFGGRHHTSVMHGYRLVQDRIHRNPKTEAAIAALIDELVA